MDKDKKEKSIKEKSVKEKSVKEKCMKEKCMKVICMTGCICLLLGVSGCGRIDAARRTSENIENDTDVITEGPATEQTEEARPSIEEEIASVESVSEPMLSQEEMEAAEVSKNPFTSLSVPTDAEKIEDTYFIVDCYNNQVIYSDDIRAPLTEWNVMCDSINQGHTIASNGAVYLIDDTENNRVLVYRKEQGKFFLVQTLNHIGERPHYVRYDEGSDAFYVLSSMTGEIYVLRQKTDEKSGEIYVDTIRRFDEISSAYCRSFTILGDRILLPASNGLILEASFPECEVLKTYQAPKEVAGLAQVYEIEGSYYFTISTDAEGNQNYATLIASKGLTELQNGEYEDLYDVLESERASTGTPYHISAFDGHYYLAEHRHGHGLFQFDVSNGGMENVEILQ